REGETAAAERTSALAADLQAARTALQAEQRKVRELEQALAQRVASGEAAREEALRESQQSQAQLRALHEALGDRDARIATLSRERASLETALEARSKAAAELTRSYERTREGEAAAAERSTTL